MKKLLLIIFVLGCSNPMLAGDGDKKESAQQSKPTPEEERYSVNHLLLYAHPGLTFNEFKDLFDEQVMLYGPFDVNIKIFGTTLLSMHANWSHHEIVNFLLEHGADPNLMVDDIPADQVNVRISNKQEKYTPLEIAYDVDTARVLLEHGANPNISGSPSLKNALNRHRALQAINAQLAQQMRDNKFYRDRVDEIQQIIDLLEPLTIPQSIDDEKIVTLIDKYGIKTAPAAPPLPEAKDRAELEEKIRVSKIPQAPELTAEQEQAIVTASQQADQKQTAQWTSNHALAASFIQSNFPKKAADLIGREKLNPFAKNDKGQTLYDIARAAKKTGKTADWNELVELMKKLSAR